MNQSSKANRNMLIIAAAATIERLEHRAYLSSTVLGTQQNLSASTANITPQFDWLADLNNDGRADLIVANSNNSIGVLLGNGNGTFATPATNYAVNGQPLPITVGDMNGDGIPDIVVGTTGSGGSPGDVSVLLGNGNGTFQSAINISALASNHAVALGAFVDGGPLDVVTVTNAASTTNNAAIVFNDGTGHASTVTELSIPHGNLSSVAVGDFGNGHADIAFLSQSDSVVTVMLGNGNGTFQAPMDFKTGASPTSLALGDFNGDGKLDIVTANSTAGSVSFLAGNGNGTFAAKVDTHVAGSSATGGPLKVRATNFNNDGKTDLFCLLSPGGSGDATILLGQGNGTFQNLQPIHTGGAQRTGIATGDLNGDGLTDVVISDPTQITTLLNVTSTDTTAPTAAVDASQAAGSTQSNVYDFSVTYTDDQQVDAATISSNNLVVTAPAGVTFAGGATTQAATLVSTGLVSGPTVTAVYQVSFAANLTTADNGTYGLPITANSVANAGGVFVPAGSIGSFTLAVSRSQPPPNQPTPPSGVFTLGAPTGKIAASVVTGSKQHGVKVVVTNTSGTTLALSKSTVLVTLYESSTNLVVTGFGSFTPVSQKAKTIKKLKPGKGFTINFPAFTWSVAGSQYLVANAQLNGVANSNDGATAAPFSVAQAFVDADAIDIEPTKPTLTVGKSATLALTVSNLGNVKLSSTATADIFMSTSGALDGTQTQIATAVPVHLHLNAASGAKVMHFSFKPTALPSTSGSFKLIITLHVVGDTDTANDTVSSTATITV